MSLTESQRHSCATILSQGLQQLDLNLSSQQQVQLLDYLALLHKWNKAYNLTAVRDPLQMVARHLLDSLSVLPHVQMSPIIDVGTGPGLPGIPLSIALPQSQFTLLDSNGKRTRFLHQVQQELGLTNITVVNARVEQHQPQQPYAGVISRAFASLQDMLEVCQNLCAKDGVFLAMKGQYPVEELSQIPKGYKLHDSHALLVPGTEAERHLIEIKSSETKLAES